MGSSRSSADAPGTSSPHPPVRRFTYFALVGLVGFVVDATILSTLVHLFGWHHYSARALSFTSAVSVTWYLNRNAVFARTSNSRREYAAYLGVQTLGAVINLGTYALVIAVTPALARYPVVPLAAGAALAMLFNYVAADRWVYATSTMQRSER